MTLRGASSDDVQSRMRAGLAVLIVGLIVLLAAVTMAIMRSTDQAPAPSTADSQADPNVLAEITMPILATMASVLVVILLVVSYALFRITRNLSVLAPQTRKPSPTPTDDVWQQHKLPPEDIEPQNQSPGTD